MVFRRDLHAIYGLYSVKYKIAGDADFVLKCVKGSAKVVVESSSFGSYGAKGVSSMNKCRSYRDMSKVSFVHKKYMSAIYYYIRSAVNLLE